MIERAPYSYRTDRSVPAFDDSGAIVIFDGHCVLCSGGVQWMLSRDPGGSTRFAAIQEAIPQALYNHYGLDAKAFDTFMVLQDGRAHIKWGGVLAAAQTLPRPWPWLSAAGRLMPRRLGDALYDWVQRNRLGWFGSREVCFMPGPATRVRLLQKQPSPARPGPDV